MNGGWLDSVDLEGLTAVRLWSSLPEGLRVSAARALYARERGPSPVRREADQAVAQALRFREAAVRQLPVGRRVECLARAVRPADSLATSLLLAFHLEERREMLAAFLDALGIPHRNGLIDEDHVLTPPDPGAVRTAADALFGRFPREQVEVYLASLFALDPETWFSVGRLLKDAG